MRYTLFLSLVFIFHFPLFTSAQDKFDGFEMHKGPVGDADGKRFFQTSVKLNDGRILGYGGRGLIGKEFIIDLYNEDLRKVKSVKSLLKNEVGITQNEGLIYLDKKDLCYLFTSDNDKKKNQCAVYCQPLDLKTLKLGKSKLLARLDYSKNNYKNPSVEIAVSSDQSKIGMSIDAVENEDKKHFKYLVVDDQIETVWERDVELDEKDNALQIHNLAITNTGKLISFAKVYQGISFYPENAKYDFVCISASDAASKLSVKKMNGGKKILRSLDMGLIDDNRIVGAGFYSDSEKYYVKNINGSYSFSYDVATDELKMNAFHQFSQTFLKQDMFSKEIKEIEYDVKKGKPLVIEYLKSNRIELNPDGSILLIGDQRSNYGQQSTKVGDIVVSKISKAGEILWRQKIRRDQMYTSFPAFFYHQSFIIGEDLYLIFNDDEFNLREKESDYMATLKLNSNSQVVLWKIDKDGNKSMFKLFPNSSGKKKVQPLSCDQISNNEAFIFTSEKKRYDIRKLVFE